MEHILELPLEKRVSDPVQNLCIYILALLHRESAEHMKSVSDTPHNDEYFAVTTKTPSRKTQDIRKVKVHHTP